MSRKLKDLRDLSRTGFSLRIDDHLRFVIVEGVKLPPGYNRSHIPIIIELPTDYPMTPPGIGPNGIFVPKDLRYGGRKVLDIHGSVASRYKTPGWGRWAWMCCGTG